MGEWTLFSNHGHVLVCLAQNNEARLRDVAASVGITERAVQNILRELQGAGLVNVSKHGRCNRYQINTRKSLRHPLESHCTVGKLLQLLVTDSAEAPSSREQKESRKVTAAEAVEPATLKEIHRSAKEAEPRRHAGNNPAIDRPAGDGAQPPRHGPKSAVSPVINTEQSADPPADRKVEPEPDTRKPAAKKKAASKKSDPSSQQGSLF